MKICILLLLLSLVVVVLCEKKKDINKLQIGITKRIKDCERKAKKGDKLGMHYTGYLESNGEKFDSSRDRGTIFRFTLGSGQVIKGWDNGLLNMCVGEIRRLVIPPHLGYGSTGAPPKIPGGSVLKFDVELMEIEGDKQEL